ncbi:hypothetical protein B0H13DRAFT_2686019 [Mycena leptocephala]|nr:hypothetical protein B0H13DRAFT_2686019 [Mycena leptocephala]
MLLQNWKPRGDLKEIARDVVKGLNRYGFRQCAKKVEVEALAAYNCTKVATLTEMSSSRPPCSQSPRTSEGHHFGDTYPDELDAEDTPQVDLLAEIVTTRDVVLSATQGLQTTARLPEDLETALTTRAAYTPTRRLLVLPQRHPRLLSLESANHLEPPPNTSSIALLDVGLAPPGPLRARRHPIEDQEDGQGWRAIFSVLGRASLVLKTGKNERHRNEELLVKLAAHASFGATPLPQPRGPPARIWGQDADLLDAALGSELGAEDATHARDASMVQAFVPASATHIYIICADLLNNQPPGSTRFYSEIHILRSKEPSLHRSFHIERFSIFGCWGDSIALSAAMMRVISLSTMDRRYIFTVSNMLAALLQVNSALSERARDSAASLECFNLSLDSSCQQDLRLHVSPRLDVLCRRHHQQREQRYKPRQGSLAPS